MSRSVFDIASDISGLIRSGVQEENPEAFEDTLESLNLEIEDKLDALRLCECNLKGDVDLLKSEIDRYRIRIASIEKNIDKIRELMLFAIQSAGKKTIRTPRATFTASKSPDSVRILDESKIPDKFYVTKTTSSVSIKLIGDAVKSGESVDGVESVPGVLKVRIR